MKYTFRVQLSLDGSWAWGVFDGESTKGFGAGEANKLAAIEAIRNWLCSTLGHPAEMECECGSRKLYRAFAPGHGFWCPVSEFKVVEVKR